jgi:hypothetical protein
MVLIAIAERTLIYPISFKRRALVPRKLASCELSLGSF